MGVSNQTAAPARGRLTPLTSSSRIKESRNVANATRKGFSMSKRRRSTLSLLVALLVSPAFAAAQGGPPAAAPVRPAVGATSALALSDEVLDDVARLRQLTVLRPVENGLKSRD